MLKRDIKHRILLIFMLLSLGLNGVLPYVAASSGIVNANQVVKLNGQDNVLLICTGTATRWISESIYFTTGKLVDIDISSLTDNTSQDISYIGAEHNCALLHISDLPSKLLIFWNLFAPAALTKDPITHLFSTFIALKKAYMQALYRAPPL